MIREFQGVYRFLSNFYPSPIIVNGESYHTIEHAYQAAKCIDKHEAIKISKSPTPGTAKKLGRKARIRPDWENIKLDVMYILILAKFRQNKSLLEQLLQTEPQELIEGNSWGDKFWGICDGVGENHLGKILMRVREELKG